MDRWIAYKSWRRESIISAYDGDLEAVLGANSSKLNCKVGAGLNSLASFIRWLPLRPAKLGLPLAHQHARIILSGGVKIKDFKDSGRWGGGVWSH